MMKRFFITLIPMAALALTLTSCKQKQAEFTTTNYTLSDSTEYVDIKLDIDWPDSPGGISSPIRATLAEVIDAHLSNIGYTDERQFEAGKGYDVDPLRFLEYYKKNTLEVLDKAASEDAAERLRYMMEADSTVADSGNEAIYEAIHYSDFPKWDCDYTLRKADETDSYILYESYGYVYLGGAHGGVVGRGNLTFDKKDGSLFEEFLKADCKEDIQPLLLKGLYSYFAEYEELDDPSEIMEYLFLPEDNQIPLPAWTPSPGEEGLMFTYQQYEIASYAAGMPSFVIPYEDIKPYMTPEAIRICGIDE